MEVGSCAKNQVKVKGQGHKVKKNHNCTFTSIKCAVADSMGLHVDMTVYVFHLFFSLPISGAVYCD